MPHRAPTALRPTVQLGDATLGWVDAGVRPVQQTGRPRDLHEQNRPVPVRFAPALSVSRKLASRPLLIFALYSPSPRGVSSGKVSSGAVFVRLAPAFWQMTHTQTMSGAPPAPTLSCEEALAVVRNSFAGLPMPQVETIQLAEALDRVLAMPIHADRDQPPFVRSTRDGYAVHAQDLTGGNPLRVVGMVRAGEQWSGPSMERGCAIEIMTGAPLPAGADCVLMVEHATREENLITPQRQLTSGENCVAQGSEAQQGEVLLAPGVRLGPAEIALAASVGAARVSVYVRPLIAILSTGDELVSLSEMPGPTQIRNSNAHALAALVRRNGGECRLMPIGRDSIASLSVAVQAARGANMLILSGGVSAGKYDLVESVLESRGAQFRFTGVAVQPGKPAVFGVQPGDGGRQWVFGLPGNPVSTQVTALLFAMPMVRALGGERDPQPAFASAELTHALTVKPGLTRFLPARMTCGLRSATVTPTGWQGSGDLNGNARANCYVVVPSDVASLEPGAIVRILLR